MRPATEHQTEYCHPSQIDQARLDEALQALPAELDRDRLRIVVTGDFARSVHNRADVSLPYTRERSTGVVGAKTFRHDDGALEILIASDIVDRRHALEVDIRRLLRHEAFHLVLGQRDEDTLAIHRRARPSQTFAYYLDMAAIALEEFRIERLLWVEHEAGDAGRARGLNTTLAESRRRFLNAVVMRYDDEPITRTFGEAVREFNALSTHMAYIAAEPPELWRPAIEAIEGTADWKMLVGESWVEFERMLREVPDASITLGATIDPITLQLADLFHRWFERIGFRIEESGQGSYFRVLRHDF